MSNFEQLLDQREAAYRTLVLKAQQDQAFRQLLKTDPTAAVKQALGKDWPEGVTLEVVEESPNKAVLVLPELFVAANDDELSDAELEMVAAGFIPRPQIKEAGHKFKQ